MRLLTGKPMAGTEPSAASVMTVRLPRVTTDREWVKARCMCAAGRNMHNAWHQLQAPSAATSHHNAVAQAFSTSKTMVSPRSSSTANSRSTQGTFNPSNPPFFFPCATQVFGRVSSLATMLARQVLQAARGGDS